jgi:hypothetical protein
MLGHPVCGYQHLRMDITTFLDGNYLDNRHGYLLGRTPCVVEEPSKTSDRSSSLPELRPVAAVQRESLKALSHLRNAPALKRAVNDAGVGVLVRGWGSHSV